MDLLHFLVLPGKTKENPAPSCEWLDKHYFNLKHGIYWTDILNPKQTYCDMTIKNGTRRYPGASCKDLKKWNRALTNGMYWIQLDKPTEMYCDMESGEGGWTMIGQAVIESEEQWPEVHYRKIMADDPTRLHEVVNKRFLLSAKGLTTLRSYIGFTQVRFFCNKQWHNRTIDIFSDKRSGEPVVDFMVYKSNARPASCGSYGTFPHDNSWIASNCEWWDARKWGHGHPQNDTRMYYRPMVINYKFSFMLGYVRHDINCDDAGIEKNFSPVGVFRFFVR